MENILNSETACNAKLSPVIDFGYTGPGTADAAERSRARREFDTGDVEKALTVLCGEILKLEYDREIFCTKIPEQVRNASAMRLLAGDPGADEDYCEGKISFFIRDREREKVLKTCNYLLITLPFFRWVTVNSSLQKRAVTISRISVAQDPEEMEVNGAGLTVTGVELIFDLRVCITPPAAEFI